jgi:3-dehydroquinate synthase
MSESTFPLQTVAISLDDRNYDIHIGQGLLSRPQTWTGLPKAQTAMIVTNDTIAPLYEAALRSAIAPHYPQVHTVVLPDGEAHKDWPGLNQIFDALLGHGCDRKTVLFALGGGVIGDMTGFAAAS